MLPPGFTPLLSSPPLPRLHYFFFRHYATLFHVFIFFDISPFHFLHLFHFQLDVLSHSPSLRPFSTLCHQILFDISSVVSASSMDIGFLRIFEFSGRYFSSSPIDYFFADIFFISFH
jgi:hypothetical protein